ncbi:tyrosine-type recombinase/integrase [Yoonia sp. SDW83-1]|uniref:tyrosine-type recombinase/integrase n=1 Tax=Yoonia sp. SDW83-1 TaxID=3366945 RepID=UPI00398C69A1
MKTEALLTPRMLASLKPKKKEYTLFDGGCPGLAVRVQPGGAMSWVTWQRAEGKTRRITLGRYPNLGLEEARAALHGFVATKTVPQIPACPTFGAVTKHFLKAKQGVYQAGTLSCMQAYLDTQLLPAVGDTRMDKITTPQLAAWFHKYARTKPGGANQALLHFTTILNWGKQNGHLPFALPNPASPIKKNRRQARGQMLNSEDLKRLFDVLAAPPPRSKDAAQIVEMVLLTGCRSGEILRLRWDEVKRNCLKLARTKTGARTVLLNDLAIKKLKQRKRHASSPFVFPSPISPNKSRSGITCCWRTIKAAAKLPPTLRLHDLRHTYASHAILAGESLYVTGKLLGHKDVHSAERYAHLDARMLSTAAEKVGTEISRMLGV